ncbi:MAG: shikimate dehydrogenase [Thermodesulfobacteriota bacterium]
MIDAYTQVYGIIGNPVKHSLSPIIHNGVFRHLGINAVYLAFEVTNLTKAIEGVRALNIAGLSVTIPFKAEIIPYLDELDELAAQIKAVNTVQNKGGKLFGFNTDWIGASQALKEKNNLTGKKVFLLGAGGAARAIAFGLKKEGCEIFIFNRSPEKGAKLAKELGATYLAEFPSRKALIPEIIINATSVGMAPLDDLSPFPARLLQEGMIVMDIVYHPRQTKLLREAKIRGCQTIDGLEMLARQAAAQTEIWTGYKPEIALIKEDLQKALGLSLRTQEFPYEEGQK